MPRRAFTRLPVEERRRQLLELGAELFARHAYDEISMARVAREAGISKPLLYHYFPRKQDFFVATLAQAAEQVRVVTEPPAGAPPAEALAASLDAFLGWVDEHELAYRKLLESAGSVPAVRALVDEVRERTAVRILDGLGVGDPPPPRLRAAAHAWLWFLDGALMDWIAHRDLTRAELRDFLLGVLGGALAAAGGERLLVREKPKKRRRVRLPTSGVPGEGFMPGVDISNNAALRDLMDEGLPLHKRR